MLEMLSSVAMVGYSWETCKQSLEREGGVSQMDMGRLVEVEGHSSLQI